RSVLDEAALVDEVGDVLASGPSRDGAATGDGVGPGLVEADDVTLDRLGEIGADVVEVDRVGLGDDGAGDVTGRDRRDCVAGHHGLPDDDVDVLDDAPVGGLDRVVHLHRLDQHHLLPGAHRLTRLDVDG